MDHKKRSLIGRFEKWLTTPFDYTPPVNMRYNSYPLAEGSFGRLISSYAQSYDGEKNMGEMGRPKDYLLNHEVLRMRSWQSYTESDQTYAIINKFSKWVIGNGLTLESDPILQVLKSEGINIAGEDFNEVMEHRFQVWADSLYCDYSAQQNLGAIAAEGYINSKVGGDMLVILRVVNDCVKVQLVDGANVMSDSPGNDVFPTVLSNGNVIRNGIEMTLKGEHIAYYVRTQDFTYTRVPAYIDGIRTAYMVYGGRYRLDSSRGMPLFSVVLETIKKLERYKEAAVGSAEERAKIPYFIKHDLNASGKNPFMQQMAKGFKAGPGKSEDLGEDAANNKLANKIGVSYNKMVFNMPQGAELDSLEATNEMYFKDFFSVNIDILCAAVGMPSEVYLSKYNSNFSASRAALKDFEHTIYTGRDDYSYQFYQPIYNLMLHLNIMLGKVNAPGYLDGWLNDNLYVIEGYRKAKFSGPSIPHIDPKKEVDAVRAKLGPRFGGVPLITYQQAVAELNGGNSDSVIRQAAAEYEEALKLKLADKPIDPSAKAGAPAKKSAESGD